MIFRNMTSKEFFDEYYNYTIGEYELPIESDCGVDHFVNFHYFSPSVSNNDYEKLLIAYDENDPFLIYGVICYGWYGYDDKYQGLSYIDVNKNYRNKGIAKALISELNNYIEKDYPLYLSFQSEDGKKYNMNQLFKKYITNTEVVYDSER